MQTQEEAIDLQSLLERASKMRIKLIAEEWLEIEGSPYRYPATNEGSLAADAEQKKRGVEDEYVRQRQRHWKQTGRPMYDIVRDLNDRMKDLGMEPQEYGFSFSEYEWRTPEEMQADSRRRMLGHEQRSEAFAAQRKLEQSRPIPLDYRWVSCYPVTGGSEGYYMHIDLIFQDAPEKSPALKLTRDLLARIEAAPYVDSKQYQADRELIERVRLSFYGMEHSHRKMLALGKTWSWDNACACCAVASTLLGA